MNLEHIKTFAANAKHTARNRKNTIIGGALFYAEELAEVARALSAVEPMAQALVEIGDMLSRHPEFARGNSVVHYAAHKAKSAAAIINGEAAPLAPTDNSSGNFLDAASAALQILEAIQATHPELISDNMPEGWALYRMRRSFGADPSSSKVKP